MSKGGMSQPQRGLSLGGPPSQGMPAKGGNSAGQSGGYGQQQSDYGGGMSQSAPAKGGNSAGQGGLSLGGPPDSYSQPQSPFGGGGNMYSQSERQRSFGGGPQSFGNAYRQPQSGYGGGMSQGMPAKGGNSAGSPSRGLSLGGGQSGYYQEPPSYQQPSRTGYGGNMMNQPFGGRTGGNPNPYNTQPTPTYNVLYGDTNPNLGRTGGNPGRPPTPFDPSQEPTWLGDAGQNDAIGFTGGNPGRPMRPSPSWMDDYDYSRPRPVRPPGRPIGDPNYDHNKPMPQWGPQDSNHPDYIDPNSHNVGPNFEDWNNQTPVPPPPPTRPQAPFNPTNYEDDFVIQPPKTGGPNMPPGYYDHTVGPNFEDWNNQNPVPPPPPTLISDPPRPPFVEPELSYEDWRDNYDSNKRSGWTGTKLNYNPDNTNNSIFGDSDPNRPIGPEFVLR